MFYLEAVCAVPFAIHRREKGSSSILLGPMQPKYTKFLQIGLQFMHACTKF